MSPLVIERSHVAEPEIADLAGDRQASDEHYGLARREARAGRGRGAWCVWLKRQGHLIYRRFADDAYGSSEVAHAMARSYRDAVLEVLPPTTNQDVAVRLRKTNRSGISGVRYVETASGGAWDVTLQTGQHKKTKRFTVSRYGEKEARARAIAQREEWLAEMPMSFLVLQPYSEAVSQRHFPERLEPLADVQSREPLSKVQVAAKLAAIDARFDALCPRPMKRLQVSVKAYDSELLHVHASDTEPRGRSLRATAMYRRRPFAEAKALAVKKMQGLIAELYTAEIARWFMEAHGNALLDPRQFDPETGFSVVVIVPEALTPG